MLLSDALGKQPLLLRQHLLSCNLFPQHLHRFAIERIGLHQEFGIPHDIGIIGAVIADGGMAADKVFEIFEMTFEGIPRTS